MLKIMKERWAENNGLLRKRLENMSIRDMTYRLLVQTTFEYIYNVSEQFECDQLDMKHMTVIDNGDYQGTLLYVIPFDTYQPSPSEYIMTFVSYGSCSGCDTLLSIIGESFCYEYEDKEVYPTDQQVNYLMMLCKDLVTRAILPFNFWVSEGSKFEEVVERN